MQEPHRIEDPRLVNLAHRDEHGSLAWHPGAAAELALGEGDFERSVDAHHFSGRPHLRTQYRIDTGETREREYRFLDADMAGLALGQVEVGKFFAGHDPR